MLRQLCNASMPVIAATAPPIMMYFVFIFLFYVIYKDVASLFLKRMQKRKPPYVTIELKPKDIYQYRFVYLLIYIVVCTWDVPAHVNDQKNFLLYLIFE